MRQLILILLFLYSLFCNGQSITDTIPTKCGFNNYFLSFDEIKWENIESKIDNSDLKIIEEIKNFSLCKEDFIESNLHTIDLDNDKINDLYIYDGWGVDRKQTYIFTYKDSLIYHSEIKYLIRIKNNKNDFNIISSHGLGSTDNREILEVYSIVKKQNKVEIILKKQIATWLTLDEISLINQDKQFIVNDSYILLGTKGNKDEKYFKGSIGYILYEDDKNYLVYMINNIENKDSNLIFIMKKLKINISKEFYSLGWINKKYTN